jgi:hypothetical protein
MGRVKGLNTEFEYMKDIIKSGDKGMANRINSIPKFKIMDQSKQKPLSIEVDS